ncbi:DJ-1/PfpI family protein [Streptomyces sp. NBC_00322]|uniref:DJ-1/PfpI family protein n=1 Tax=Streptomyces sp. NBC_00322 TaxID=2975712 RepID=UPI002E2E2790|nr:DJ-1/PfpI family protein [Streptomyces sp. NBC_00322]
MLAQIVLFDGFDPLDVIAPYEVLTAGGMVAGGELTVELVSAEGAREVPSGMGMLSLRAVGVLDPERADLVLVPGAAGRISDDGGEDTVPAILGRSLNTPLPGLLKAAVERPELVMSTVCGGSMLLAMAGLIADRRATTHHMGLDALAGAGVHAVEARVVDDGDLVTGAGVTSGLDLALYLLERELGPRIAHEVERLFSHERRGTVWRASGTIPVSEGLPA